MERDGLEMERRDTLVDGEIVEEGVKRLFFV